MCESRETRFVPRWRTDFRWQRDIGSRLFDSTTKNLGSCLLLAPEAM